MKITIHTPSAGVRSVSVDGMSGRFIIQDDTFNGTKRIYRLIDTYCQFGRLISSSIRVRHLEFELRRYLESIERG